jgi:hypothetical protein
MVHTFISPLPMSENRREELQQATAQDSELQTLAQTIHRGWPSSNAEAPQATRPYWTIRDELYEVSGLLFKGIKVIIPVALRPKMLRDALESH